ncbi:hypothetical protein TCARB_1561 [Thermofilum adornatum 1505]|uniref:Uncharacterized protein n=1 Tax=Thermofilum adornatum 1505 TaxID=697581 RepID=A0A3G1A8F5_9CREN|nr:hypothetical protein TCARB_1561 [Thermofilum adornatum 1505]
MSRLIVAALLVALCVVALAYYLLRDVEPPRVERLELLERVRKGGVQRVFVCVREGNPSGSATLQLNGTIVEIPLTERSGDLACYASTFNVSTFFAGEGRVAGKLVVRDTRGNTATVDVSFYVNLEAPKIVSVELQRADFGRYEVSARIEDENLREVFILVGERSIPLAPSGGLYRAVLEVLNDTDFTLRAVDRLNLSSSYRGRIEFSRDNPNAAYALGRGLNLSLVSLILPLDSDREQDANEKQFIDLIVEYRSMLAVPAFSNYLWRVVSDGSVSSEELERARNFAQLVVEIYETVLSEKSLYESYVWGYMRVKDPVRTADYSSNLALKLGLDGSKTSKAVAKALAYYGIAVVDRGLPENLEELAMLVEAVGIEGYGSKLVDFTPITFHSTEGDFAYVIDSGRDAWMLAKHLKIINDTGFNILKHPEMFEGLNGKIIANAYSLFDAEYGINYAEQFISGRKLRPTDNDVWDLIMLQWSLYSNKAPQLGGGGKLYNRDFPWYDSDKLDALYQDDNTRRQALFFLFYLDNGAFDIEAAKRFELLVDPLPREVQEDLYELISDSRSQSRIIPGYRINSLNDLLKWIDLVTYEKKLIDEQTANKLKKEIATIPFGFIVTGLKGAKTALIQAEREYEAISKLYPDGKIGRWNEDPRYYYYGWLMDRQNHGLSNTVYQYTGVKIDEYKTWPEFIQLVNQRSAIDQYITKNWKYWDLVKFVTGYERWNHVYGMDEMDEGNYITPQTLRAFGFPMYFVHIEPTPVGAAAYEWVVSLPDYIAEGMKASFNDTIIVGPANGFGLHLCKDGILRDGIKELFGFVGGTSLYRQGEIVWANCGLTSNIRFYFTRKRY